MCHFGKGVVCTVVVDFSRPPKQRMTSMTWNAEEPEELSPLGRNFCAWTKMVGETVRELAKDSQR
jgi:hypothetical protein